MDIELEVQGLAVKVLDGAYTADNAITGEGIEFATSIVDDLDAYKTTAADQLVSLYNEVWLDDKIGELSATQIASLLINPKVVIYDVEGAACIYFNDSDMFAGHYVEISIDQFQVNGIGIVG
ncbi:MAG: DUF2262 domain-containing protein [Pseudomonadota bacterium]